MKLPANETSLLLASKSGGMTVLLTGKSLGKYQLSERIGRGGMADVYKGYHARLDRLVAVKVLHPHLIEGKDFLARFEQEAKTVATLRHPNIVQVYDFDLEDDFYYMIMEYVDGGTLKEKLETSAQVLPLAEVKRYFRQIAEALDYAHQGGMLHRDIKPSNILLDSEGQAYLTDFGIARLVDSAHMTATGTLIGTPAYMSPEQGQGLELNTASDIYSLGVVLYEMVTGKVPFDADTPIAILQKHVNEPLTPPSTLRPDLPTTWEHIIMKALAKKPAERYPTVGAMLADLLKAAAETHELDQANTTQVMVDETQPQPADKSEPSALQEEATIPMDGALIEENIEDIATEVMTGSIQQSETNAHQAQTLFTQAPPAQDRKTTPTAAEDETETAKKPLLKKALISILAVIVIAAGLFAALLFAANGEEDQPQETQICNGAQECIDLAFELRSSGDLLFSAEAFEMSLSYISEEQHPPFAFVHCELGTLYQEMGDLDMAIEHLYQCRDWTEDDHDLEPVRAEAQRLIEEVEAMH